MLSVEFCMREDVFTLCNVDVNFKSSLGSLICFVRRMMLQVTLSKWYLCLFVEAAASWCDSPLRKDRSTFAFNKISVPRRDYAVIT